MILGGLQPCSFSDYPMKTAAVVFTQGCNFRCPFCHNGSLLQLKGKHLLNEAYFFDFLHKRTGLLGGVVVSGGEPTLQHDLPHFIGSIKDLGFPVKLDTNGSNPAMIKYLLTHNLVDYITMDIKAPLSKYSKLCGVQIDTQNICNTIELIATHSIPHHFRTTEVVSLLSRQDIQQLQALVPSGSKHILQPFIAETARQV